MNYWLAQLILAARNRDEDSNWMQILFFVIVSIFWAVGSVVKAKAGKTVPKKGKDPRKPAGKKPEITIDLQKLKQLWSGEKSAPGSESRPQTVKPQVRPVSRKVVRPRPAVKRKMPTETKEAVKFPTFESQPEMEEVPGLTTEATMAAEVSQAKYLSDILSDYEDPEKLRRAILHYEILGKPVSMREPSEHTIGF